MSQVHRSAVSAWWIFGAVRPSVCFISLNVCSRPKRRRNDCHQRSTSADVALAAEDHRQTGSGHGRPASIRPSAASTCRGVVPLSGRFLRESRQAGGCALFEPADAVLCVAGPVRTLVELLLAAGRLSIRASARTGVPRALACHRRLDSSTGPAAAPANSRRSDAAGPHTAATIRRSVAAAAQRRQAQRGRQVRTSRWRMWASGRMRSVSTSHWCTAAVTSPPAASTWRAKSAASWPPVCAEP